MRTSSLEDHIGYWLRFASNHISSSFRKKLETHDVGVAEWVVLRILLDEKMLSPGKVAEMLDLTKGAMSKLIDRLVLKKLVIRVESSEDRRFQEIKLSKTGKELVPILARLADENDQQYFGHLTKREKEQLVKTLKKIVSLNQCVQIPIH